MSQITKKIIIATIFLLSPYGLVLAEAPQYGISNGLVGYWSLDARDIQWTSSTSGSVRDRSGNNNTGTITNMSNTSSPIIGKLGQGLDFDGVNDHILIPNSSVFNVQSYTISAWIKTSDAGSGRRRIFSQQVAGGTGDYYLMALNANRLEIGDKPASILLTKGSALNNNAWRHVAIRKKAGVSFDWYVDGISIGTQSTLNTTTHTMTDAVYIAKYISSDLENFNGFIDEVRIYNRALSPDEVNQLYRLGLSQHKR